MRIHIIEGEPGCRRAVDLGATAIIVDALRASATAAALLAEGAAGLCIVREVEDAFAVKKVWPDALLFGERGGLPPPGFDYGNSPREALHARGKKVIFTTTTGAGRMLAARNAGAVLMGSVVNSAAIVRYLFDRLPDEVVLIPAGLMGDPHFDAQEDWAAAVRVASNIFSHGRHVKDILWGEGHGQYQYYKARINTEGLERLFLEAPHADKLRAIGLEQDISVCAVTDSFNALPLAVEPFGCGLLVQDVLLTLPC